MTIIKKNIANINRLKYNQTEEQIWLTKEMPEHQEVLFDNMKIKYVNVYGMYKKDDGTVISVYE